MFTDFLYMLRSYGLKVSLVEWSALLDALSMGLEGESLLEFYHMARAILVKRETDYDRFDQAFAAYFKGIAEHSELSDAMEEWLTHVLERKEFNEELANAMWKNMTLEEIEALMRQRLAEQKSEHHGGTKWIGTGGLTPFGHSGYAPKGIRIRGKGRNHRALKVAEERNYRDFRDDHVLEIRQFQMALRKLRRLSNKDEAAATELDVEGTIEETGKHAGMLQIVMKKPRKNQTKLLLLMDSGGSMDAYITLCSRLFQAVHDSNHFKDLKTYYFHNCWYEYFFTEPSCRWSTRISTEQILNNIKSEYKVIVIGDAYMGPAELLYEDGNIDYYHGNEKPGLYWIERTHHHFPGMVWLNPLHEKLWNYDYGMRTVGLVAQRVPMFPLTLNGLERAIDCLQKASV
jgi:uncharacterized protein with von Willebrand factor type A (vWA) domain